MTIFEDDVKVMNLPDLAGLAPKTIGLWSHYVIVNDKGEPFEWGRERKSLLEEFCDFTEQGYEHVIAAWSAGGQDSVVFGTDNPGKVLESMQICYKDRFNVYSMDAQSFEQLCEQARAQPPQNAAPPPQPC